MATVAIGIDSGGTHSTCAVERGEGAEVSFSDEASSSISGGRGSIAARESAEWIIGRILHHSLPGDEVCVWIGAASAFHEPTSLHSHELFEPLVRRLKESRAEIQIFIANDAVSILKSPPLLGKGIAAIVGTGSIVIGYHPEHDRVVRRGGFDWPVGDEGAGAWLTIECVRKLLYDIQSQEGSRYHSALLDRLCDHFGASTPRGVPDKYRAFARAENLAAIISEMGEEGKRRIAAFAHPHIFELAQAGQGRLHDPIAAQVIQESVSRMVGHIDHVSTTLAAFTADEPADRESLDLVIGGSIAANPIYQQQLQSGLSTCKYVTPVDASSDSAGRFAALAWHYLHSSPREQRLVARSLDSLHAVHSLV